MENAGYLERFVAAMIDSVIASLFLSVAVIIMIVLSIILMVPLFGYEPPVYTQSNLLPPQHGYEIQPMIIVLLIIALLLCIAFIIFVNFFLFVYRPYKHSGQTYGKQLMNIKVVRVDGKELTLGLLTLRCVVSAVMNNAISFLTYITILFNQERRTIYDIIVGTKVVTIE